MLGDTSRFRDIPARGYGWSGPVPMGHWMGSSWNAPPGPSPGGRGAEDRTDDLQSFAGKLFHIENATAHRLRRPVRASRPGGGLSVADLGDQRKRHKGRGGTS